LLVWATLLRFPEFETAQELAFPSPDALIPKEFDSEKALLFNYTFWIGSLLATTLALII